MTEDRRESIQELLRERGEVSVLAFVKELTASEATIRRDLAALEEAGVVTRTFGGARLKDTPSLVVRCG